MKRPRLFGWGFFLNTCPDTRHQDPQFPEWRAMSDLFVRMAVRGRVYGLNVGDWSMLLAGVAPIGLLALLI